MKTITVGIALATLAATAGIAQMNHNMDHSSMAMSEEQMAGAVHAKAVVNSMGDGIANVSHDPIPEIGWPAMTMDLTVLEGAEMMGEISSGDEVTLMLVKGASGMYAIAAMMPH